MSANLKINSVRSKYITLGTMRFLEIDRSISEWLYFLCQARDLGVLALHSSSEYASFHLVKTLLSESLFSGHGSGFRHICKLAEPSFTDTRFSAENLERKVHDYCEALSTPVLHDVQWMWRQNLDDDGRRQADFMRSLDEIGAASINLKRQGLIERLLCFPYTNDFAAAAIEHEAIDGLVVYRNRREREYDDVIRRCGDLSKVCHVIRPFDSGGALDLSSNTPGDLLRFALDLPAIETAILSTNNLEHICELTSVVEQFV